MPRLLQQSPQKWAGPAARRFHSRVLLGWTAVAMLLSPSVHGAPTPTAQFRKEIQPILQEFCYDCHGDGSRKGDVAFDELKSNDAILNHELWLKALKNVRAGLMPPQKKPQPSAQQIRQLEDWVKYGAFGIDAKNPDPGRVTVRRLNRVEYRNTIRDLMGVDFNATVEFPPDDTGFGFDNIGDVLTISPMLLEKYMDAAKSIVTESVPVVSRVIPEKVLPGNRFRTAGSSDTSGNRNGGNRAPRDSMLSLSFYDDAVVSTTQNVEQSGDYKLGLELRVKGNFDFDPGRCRVVFKVDGRQVLETNFSWQAGKTFPFEFDQKWEAGDHGLVVEVHPLTPVDKKINSLDLQIVSATVRGPLDQKYWTRPKNYERFFPSEIPSDAVARQKYARKVLETFATKAFRRPVDARTVDRLLAVAETIYNQPGKTVEAGIAQGMIGVLASPRFLFRLEEPVAGASRKATSALVDEYSLASRLSYFLWSTLPDEELMGLASRGELRKNQTAQIKRMLSDRKSEAFVQNFTGQWLQNRDIEGATIDARVVLARDDGQERQMRQQQEEFRARFANPNAATNRTGLTNSFGLNNQLAGTNRFGGTNQPGRGNNRQRFFQPRVQLDRPIKVAMQSETEMYFAHIVREDRSVTELIDSDYTFLNDKLATFYGITNVTGTEMHRVTLPPDSPRGGVLTHGSVLVVTSNPDRTSPVKRGIFILSNILGTPTPPPPANVPALEAAEKDFKDKDHDPTLRESLAAHRNEPLCNSCHVRMDPIGLAFENFNAMGMWRDKERGQAIDGAGKLVTGETFNGVSELKKILAKDHRMDFYRCLTEKLLTYALGRGVEYYDMETMDQIVRRLDKESGRFSALLMGIVESAPFQKQRLQALPVQDESTPSPGKKTAVKKVAQN